jgi:two-component system, chemotaxis family, chemotaxis protein CheY
MNVLVVEDDFTSRKLLQSIIAEYGECDVAVNGEEAVEAVRGALENNRPYDLICLDIMMPEMDGQEALRQIRALEDQKELRGLSGAKILMTTALGDSGNVMAAFRSQCDGYITKPIDKKKIREQLKTLGLLEG